MSSTRLRILRVLIAIALIVALAGLGVVKLAPAGSQLSAWLGPSGGHKIAVAPPLIFGTNLTLYDSNDQILNSIASQRLLKQARVPIMRMPFRSPRGSVDEIRALRAIQYIGAIPVVIVHGPNDASALSDDRALIQLVRNIYGDGLVYVEFGNEPDLAGIDVRSYAASWNAVVPALEKLAPSYRFIGPSVSAAEPDYIAAFDRLAKPRPYANSWHEYACTAHMPDASCIDAVARWTDHVQWINDAVQKTIGTRLPLLITEWNLDAAPDARFADPIFMDTWTALAVQTLALNMPHGLAGAIQYCVSSNGNFDLIAADNSLTPEGRTFFAAMAASVQPAA